MRKGGKRLEQSDGSCTVYFPRFMPFNLYLEKAEGNDLTAGINNLNRFITGAPVSYETGSDI